MAKLAPVTLLVRMLASSRTRSAISSGRVKRPVMLPDAAWAAMSAALGPPDRASVWATPGPPSHSAVSTGPGLIVLTRTPIAPTSLDKDLQKLVSAALAAE